MKTCFKCLVAQPLSDFYAHPMMSDGHLGKCKSCTKADNAASRLARIDYYREYDRERAKLPHRRELSKQIVKAWHATDKRRRRAHNAAKRGHRKAPEACQMCGQRKRLERHHPDYDLPLLIVWLCKPCHMIADKARRDRERV